MVRLTVSPGNYFLSEIVHRGVNLLKEDVLSVVRDTCGRQSYMCDK